MQKQHSQLDLQGRCRYLAVYAYSSHCSSPGPLNKTHYQFNNNRDSFVIISSSLDSGSDRSVVPMKCSVKSPSPSYRYIKRQPDPPEDWKPPSRFRVGFASLPSATSLSESPILRNFGRRWGLEEALWALQARSAGFSRLGKYTVDYLPVLQDWYFRFYSKDRPYFIISISWLNPLGLKSSKMFPPYMTTHLVSYLLCTRWWDYSATCSSGNPTRRSSCM
jgi:hypothetical protein